MATPSHPTLFATSQYPMFRLIRYSSLSGKCLVTLSYDEYLINVCPTKYNDRPENLTIDYFSFIANTL